MSILFQDLILKETCAWHPEILQGAKRIVGLSVRSRSFTLSLLIELLAVSGSNDAEKRKRKDHPDEWQERTEEPSGQHCRKTADDGNHNDDVPGMCPLKVLLGGLVADARGFAKMICRLRREPVDPDDGETIDQTCQPYTDDVDTPHLLK